MDAAGLLAAADSAAASLDDALYGLPDDAFLSAPDGGWTIKDILGHLAAWNEYLVSALDGRGGLEALGLPHDAVSGGDGDQLNAALVERWSGMSLDEAWARYAASRGALRARITTLEPSTLAAPFRQVAPDSPFADAAPLSDWVRGVAAEHVDEHLPRIMELADALSADMTVEGELAALDETVAALAALAARGAVGDASRRDEGGWSAADHLAHLAAWNRELVAVIGRQSVAEAMGVPQAVWNRGDETEINAAIHDANRDLGPERALDELRRSLDDPRRALQSLDDADLRRPRIGFDGEESRLSHLPLLRWVHSCTTLHPAGHLPAIAGLLVAHEADGKVA